MSDICIQAHHFSTSKVRQRQEWNGTSYLFEYGYPRATKIISCFIIKKRV
jgi:hypothetical protein